MQQAQKVLIYLGGAWTIADNALVNAETFVTALKCARSKAATYIGPRGQALRQNC
jgi:hypothetical protein